MNRYRASLVVVLVGLMALGIAASAQEQITLSFAFHFGADIEHWRAIVNRFEELNPHIKVELIQSDWPGTERLMTLAAAGNMPDVFYIYGNDVPTFADANLVADLKPHFERTGVNLAEVFVGPDLLFNYKGGIYTVTYDVNGWYLGYNRDMFDSYGLEAPRPDWTWSEFREAARLLTADRSGDGVVDQWGFENVRSDGNLDVMLLNFGASTFDAAGELALDTDAAKTALEFWADVIQSGYTPARWQGHDQWLAGKSAMVFSDPPWVGTYSDQLQFAWGVQWIPAAPGVARQTLGSSGDFGMSGLSKHPNEAFELLMFLVGEEVQETLVEWRGSFPGNRNVVPTWLDRFERRAANRPENVAVILDLISNSVPRSSLRTSDPARAASIVSSHITRYFDGQISLTQALETIATEYGAIK